MTRINCGIPPKCLSQKHLIAEHREIKRIPNTISSGKAIINDIPDTFRLGTGHVKFFYNKLGYLLDMYKELYAECRTRGYDVQNYESAWDNVPQHLMGNYEPTERQDNRLEEDIGKVKSTLKARHWVYNSKGRVIGRLN